MNEELQQAITTLINKAVSGADATAEFLSGEIPDYIYQLLMWYGVSSFIKAAFGVVLLVCTVYFTKKIGKKMYKDYQDKKEWTWTGCDATLAYGMAWLALAMAASISFIISLRYINIEWLKIWIAPKVWLVDYAAQLVKPIVAN